MIARKRKSGIINVSSIAAAVPVPGLAIYNASKSFVHFFVKALSYELWADDTGVDMMEYEPCMVYTKLSLYRQGLFTIPASLAASYSLDDLGQTFKSSGPYKHGVRAWIVRTSAYYMEGTIFKSQHKANKAHYINGPNQKV